MTGSDLYIFSPSRCVSETWIPKGSGSLYKEKYPVAIRVLCDACEV